MDTELTSQQKKILLDIARKAVESTVRHGACQYGNTDDPSLQKKRGCFVTLKKNGELRGCLGTFESDSPLHIEIANMASAAAMRDPRFYPMTTEDLADYSIEISVLSERQLIEDPQQVEVGRHGLYIQKGFSRGVLLPQVASEQGWGRLTFLQQTCRKAGLELNDWKEPETDLYIFTAEVFNEE